MRTAKYILYIDNTDDWRHRDGKNRALQWSKFIALCQSLDKDGFTYTVQVRTGEPMGPGHIRLLIAGVAGRAERTVTKRAKRYTMPALLTPEQCGKRATEAKRLALAGKIIHRQRMCRPGWYEDREKAFNRKAGRLIAKAKARGEAHIDAGGLYPGTFQGGRKFNVDQLIAERKQKVYPIRVPDDQDRITEQQERLTALADYKFWRELEALSGQRQRFKPGLTADNITDDQEVAA